MRWVVWMLMAVSACTSEAPVLSGVGYDRALGFELSLPDGGAHAGTNPLTVRTLDPSMSEIVEGLQVRVHAHMPAMDHEAEESLLEEEDPGLYEGVLFFTMPGAWQVHIEAEGDEAVDALLLDLDVG